MPLDPAGGVTVELDRVLGDVRTLGRSWWLFLLRGLLAIAFGVLTFSRPLAALTALVIVYGAWAFFDGITALVLAVQRWRTWHLFAVGILGVAVGLITFFNPSITALGLYIVVAGWSIARGIIEIVLAIRLRKQIQGEVWMVLGGIASIVFGALLIAMPAAGLLALAWLVAIYAVTFGVIMLFLSARLHSFKEKVEPRPMVPPIGVPPIRT
jgi:uncharacterized membrane protein HdeD (DUF308 family)